MTNLHAHILSIIKANQANDNNVTQVKPSPEKFRLTSNPYGITLSDELLAQLDRYCEANPFTPQPTKLNPNPQTRPAPRSKVIRKAVYEMMENPTQLNNIPSRLPTVALPPERPNHISWTMPTKRPKDAQRLHDLCSHYGLKQFIFVRRAIYMYTASHKSTDITEANTAAKDAWF